LILARILALTFAHKWLLAICLLCVSGATAAYLVLPWLFGIAIDEVYRSFGGGSVSEATILSISLTILAVSLIRGALTFGQTYFGERLSQAVAYDIRNRFYGHVQNLSFKFHDTYHTGNLMSRAITDVEAFRMFIMSSLVRSPYFAILFFATAGILIWMDWVLGLVALSFMPVLVILTAVLRMHLRRIWLRVQEDMADLSTTLQENMTGVRVVKAFAAERYEEAKYEASSAAVSDDMVRASRIQALNTSVMVFVYLVVIGLILGIGGMRVINGHMSPGDLASFLFYMQILALPVQSAGMVVNSYARAYSAGQRLFEVLDYRSHVEEFPGAREMPKSSGHVRFNDVSFSYDGRTPTLRNIDIDASPGKVVALVGAPGSGKSTLVNLLPRFYDITSGSITLDGVEIQETTLKSLRSNIGMVQQDVFLFTASLRDNIAYGREDATMDEIVAAARVAQLDDYIQGLDDGYDTEVGERGSTLSGGQRQRMSIARAVLLDPPVLILDDSTASVDANTEEKIRTAMEAVMKDRTTFVIAHRLSTVHKADEIIVLDRGRIAERGTHEELLARGGAYRRIYELQLRPQEEVMMEFDVPAETEAAIR
jgi:ATP-binding cassette subfamily B protein